MIAQVELEYSCYERLTALCAEGRRAELEACLSTLPAVESQHETYMWTREQIIDVEVDGPRLLALGLPFVVKKFKGTLPLTTILPDGKHYEVFVQVPPIGLLTINEVEVLTDACTDALQQHLDDGWRILCVCPPNAQRRPDYVIGRTKSSDVR